MVDVPDLTETRTYLSGTARWVSSRETPVSENWTGYISENRTERMDFFRKEMKSLEDIFPKTVHILLKIAQDAFVINCKDSPFGGGILRVLNLNFSSGETLVWASRQLDSGSKVSDFKKHLLYAPRELSDLYTNRFDGFADAFLTGLLPSVQILPIIDQRSGLTDAVWMDEVALRTDVSRVYHLASNSGGVHALIDLSKNQSQSDDPDAIWVDDDDGLLRLDAPMWSFVDSMMEIALTQ